MSNKELDALRESPLDMCFFVAALISKEPIDAYYAPCSVTRQRHEELKNKSNHDFIGTTSAIVEAQLAALAAAPATEPKREFRTKGGVHQQFVRKPATAG